MSALNLVNEIFEVFGYREYFIAFKYKVSNIKTCSNKPWNEAKNF